MNRIGREELEKMLDMAEEAMHRAYTPYSNFQVGACLRASDGEYYLGCNIENASYSPTVCAERTAFFKAVSEGVRDFEAIAIVGGKGGEIAPFCAPCGVCRQVMAEFCDVNTFKLVLGSPKQFDEYLLSDVLPFAFTPKDVK